MAGTNGAKHGGANGGGGSGAGVTAAREEIKEQQKYQDLIDKYEKRLATELPTGTSRSDKSLRGTRLNRIALSLADMTTETAGRTVSMIVQRTLEKLYAEKQITKTDYNRISDGLAYSARIFRGRK